MSIATLPALPGARMTAALVTAKDALRDGRETRMSGVLDAELTGALPVLGEVFSQAHLVAVQVVAEALERGLLAGRRHHLIDAAMLALSGISRAQATDIVRLAQASIDTSDPDARVAHQPIFQALNTGQLCLRRAALTLAAVQRVRPAIPEPGAYGEAVRLVLGSATDPLLSEADLRTVTDHLAAVILPEKDLADREKAAHAMRGVFESSLAGDSLRRFIIDTDPENAALLDALFSSPLTRPQPQPALAVGEAGELGAAAADAAGTGATVPDRRTVAQRRHDALFLMLGRAIANPESAARTSRTQIVITMSHRSLSEALARHLGAAAAEDPLVGDLFHTGVTAQGRLLAAATIRRLACDAEIIPAVLGSQGEVLDLGRSHRLVTRGQRRALELRDGGCSFPGCTMPAPWCDAHHIVPWAQGGRSDLSNYALLCQRHHTHVHERRLTASVDPRAKARGAVRWDRTAERYSLRQ